MKKFDKKVFLTEFAEKKKDQKFSEKAISEI